MSIAFTENSKFSEASFFQFQLEHNVHMYEKIQNKIQEFRKQLVVPDRAMVLKIISKNDLLVQFL